ncbi:TRAP transporter small permease [Paracoccus lichenicola]|uniref:TRAP transporter small permease n=1 Tax=Paracoccus lichenicola TaxID=2665644 RepID=UPI0018A8FDB6|nr:TRAP transporter small permease [Paracoccus lichenicola]
MTPFGKATMRKTGQFIYWVNRLLLVIGGVSVTLMMLHITADVAGRFLFNAPLAGTITIVSHYYMIFAVFLPIALAEEENAHISVEVFTERFSPAVQHHISGLTLMVSCAMTGVMAMRTWGEAVAQAIGNASVVQGAKAIVVWPTYFALPVGFGLMTIVLAFKIVLYLTASTARISATGE